MKTFSERLSHAWDDCGFECERDTVEVEALIKEGTQLEADNKELWKSLVEANKMLYSAANRLRKRIPVPRPEPPPPDIDIKSS